VSSSQAQDVFHIAAAHEWAQAQQRGEYRTSSLEAEGFIHCSTRDQVLGTARRFFARRTDLLLLRLDGARLAPLLRYEAPVPASQELDGQRFPHLYAALPLDAVVACAPLAGDGAGGYRWPQAAGFE
jgi:uncharacterized protein (DUF952 family)